MRGLESYFWGLSSRKRGISFSTFFSFFSFFSFSLLFLLFLPFSKTAKDDDFIANKCLKFLESTKATKRQTVVKAQKEQQGLSKKKYQQINKVHRRKGGKDALGTKEVKAAKVKEK